MNSELFPRLRSRYKDGYIVALAIVSVGTAVKVIGVLAWLSIIAVSFVLTVDSGRGGVGFFLGLVVGGIVAALFFVIGTLVAAQGQILRASLDSAVNNSPHISNEEKAEIMFLSSAPSGENISTPNAETNLKRLFWGGAGEEDDKSNSKKRDWGDDVN